MIIVCLSTTNDSDNVSRSLDVTVWLRDAESSCDEEHVDPDWLYMVSSRPGSLTVCLPVRLRDRGAVVAHRSVLRAVLRDLPTSGEHPAAGEARGHGPDVRVDLLLHLDLPSSAGLEQIQRQQDRNQL